MKIVYEILKAPRWNASSSINTCNHQKSREKNPHIPAHPKLQFPEIALENTILLTGPHAFVSFPTGSSGGLQSFLLIRELILERFPQPVNTPEPMEPIEPTEGGVDLQEGWSLGETKTRGFWDFRIKGKSQNWSLTLLCLDVGVWNILGERQLNRWEFHKKDMWVSFAVCICMYKSDFHSNFTVQICTQWMCFWKLLTPNPKGSKQLPI